MAGAKDNRGRNLDGTGWRALDTVDAGDIRMSIVDFCLQFSGVLSAKIMSVLQLVRGARKADRAHFWGVNRPGLRLKRHGQCNVDRETK